MKAIIFFVFVSLGMCLFANDLQVGPGELYPTIQEAMLAAADGDTISVQDGVYTGRVIVDKQVLLRSVNGFEYTFIQADTTWASPIDIYADHVTVEGFSVFAAISTSGISVKGASYVTIRGNRSGWDASHTNKVGIQFYSHGGNQPSHCLITDNVCSYNNEGGIYIIHHHHTVAGNICENNTSTIYSGIYGIGVYASTTCTIKDNVCRYNDVGLKYYYNSHNDTIVGNQFSHNGECGVYVNFQHSLMFAGNQVFENSDGGFWLSGVHYSYFWSNTLSGNTVGVNARYCSNLDFHLNSFSDLTKFENLSCSDYRFKTPTKLCYFYNYNSQKDFMGNYYNDFTGPDDNGDGIGDSTYSLGDYVDVKPLMQPRDAYNLQVWFLNLEQMFRDDETVEANNIALEGTGSTYVWIADGPVIDGISYPEGVAADLTTWTGMLCHSVQNSYDFTMEIGYSDGMVFSAGGPEATLSYTSRNHNTRLFLSSENAFTIPGGNYLALKMTVNNYHPLEFYGGGAWSYISAPIGSPEYVDQQSELEAPELVISYAESPEFSYVLLEWSAVPGATAYNVYSSDTPYGGFSPEPTGIGITELNWYDFAEFGARKFYRVTAVD